MQYFISWFSSHSSSSSSLLMTSVSSVLSLGSSDLDWEVKAHTLALAELLLDEALSGHRGYRKSANASIHPYAAVSGQVYALHTHAGTHLEGAESDLAAVLKYLVEQGVISALLAGLVDCDRPVALKACQLLVALRETVCPASSQAPDAPAVMATVSRVSCELPGWGWGLEIRKMLRVKACEADVAAAANGADAVDPPESGEMGDNNVRGGQRGVCVGVCEALRSLGLDAQLEILTQSSDHVHNSPLSLLQDILTASAAHTHSDTQLGEEVIVDCY